MTIISDFISSVISTHKTGKATEHSYRPALKTLFDALAPDEIEATNEPKREACGAPDFILQRGDIAVGHVEAKDIFVDLRAMKDANKNQKERYLKALPNLIYTNCLDWDFYRDGQLVASAPLPIRSWAFTPTPSTLTRWKTCCAISSPRNRKPSPHPKTLPSGWRAKPP